MTTDCCNVPAVEGEGSSIHYRALECGKCHQWIKWIKWPDTPEARVEFIDRYKVIAEAKGYKIRWVGHQFKAIFGSWPPDEHGIPKKDGD